MAEFKDRTFSGKPITLDGNSYEDCSFVRCSLRYSAAQPAVFTRVQLEDCSWAFSGAALATLQFLGMLYQGGLGESADGILAGVQGEAGSGG